MILKLLVKHQFGIALILTILLMTLILFLSLYILNFSLMEDRIAKSQSWGVKTYYLAESGIQDMIWKLKNDDTYKNNFENDPNWSAGFTRTNPFGLNSGAYSVTIANTSSSHGEIIASSTINIGDGKYSRRTIKTKVYRLIGLSGMGTNAVLNGGGTINILNSDQVTITGNTYSNSAFIMQGSHPIVVITGDLTTTSYITEGNGDLNVTGITLDSSSVPPPTPNTLPGVDFNELKNEAVTTLSNDAALDATSTISGLTWVNTAVDIENNMNIYGQLVVNGNLIITNSANINIYHASGSPSGLIVNGNILISKNPNYNGNINIEGIVYAAGSITLEKLNSGYSFIVTGGITSGNGILIKNCSRLIQIIYNNEILTESLNSSSNSPIIVIEHWEEEY